MLRLDPRPDAAGALGPKEQALLSQSYGARQQKSSKAPVWQPLPERRLRCHKCGYEWDTRSKLKYVTCPSCHYKIDSSKCVVAKVPRESP
ncbi:MAG: hypothetical protein JRM88_04070 [Nitrososphaerota archaeon]|jgi:protein-arginine kinase activator protein McsA|nr:hypothetical protein [Nitrososphaerota archaeon]